MRVQSVLYGDVPRIGNVEMTDFRNPSLPGVLLYLHYSQESLFLSTQLPVFTVLHFYACVGINIEGSVQSCGSELVR